MLLEIPEVKRIVPKVHHDERGLFFESFRASEELPEFVQDNISISKKNTIRALHYQKSPGQVKFVRCIQGRIWDVAVDIRPASKTFGKWVAFELNDREFAALLIPIGFAHGFCALKDSIVQYKVSAFYDETQEMSIRWNDPDLNIPWPVDRPILSKKDQMSPFLHEAFSS
jgi:dTDP-4-dehydrorhamnose 3,5-epimerase